MQQAKNKYATNMHAMIARLKCYLYHLCYCLCFLAVIGISGFSPKESIADSVTNVPVGTLPATPMNPTQGEEHVYAYDLQTSMQASYWGSVLDSLGSKFNAYEENLAALDSGEKMLNAIEKNKIAISLQEAQILCLFGKENDKAVSEKVKDLVTPKADWPEWPNCGGILEKMFGPNIINYLNGADEARLDIYRYLLEIMGLNPRAIQDTIKAQGGNFELIGADEEKGDDQLCYTSGSSIDALRADECGILCTVTKVIMGMLSTASKAMYQATVGNANFEAAVLGALILYITIYGAMVLLGLQEVKLNDAVIRIAKMTLIATMFTSDYALMLFDFARCTFVEGSIHIINGMLNASNQAVSEFFNSPLADRTQFNGITAHSVNICTSSMADTAAPLQGLEVLFRQIFSTHMMVNLLAVAWSSPYGFFMAIFLAVAIAVMIMALLGAVTLYFTALIAQYLLLSLLPIFICFLLFKQTANLFEGWLKQIITYTLTPILMFVYLALFTRMIDAVLAQIISSKVCWIEWPNVVMGFDLMKLAFFIGDKPVNDPPFGFFEILILYLLVSLLKEFHESVEGIARTLGGATVFFGAKGGGIGKLFQGLPGKAKDLAVDTGKGANKAADDVKSMRPGGTGPIPPKPTYAPTIPPPKPTHAPIIPPPKPTHSPTPPVIPGTGGAVDLSQLGKGGGSSGGGNVIIGGKSVGSGTFTVGSNGNITSGGSGGGSSGSGGGSGLILPGSSNFKK